MGNHVLDKFISVKVPDRASAFAESLVVERASLARPTSGGWQHIDRGLRRTGCARILAACGVMECRTIGALPSSQGRRG